MPGISGVTYEMRDVVVGHVDSSDDTKQKQDRTVEGRQAPVFILGRYVVTGLYFADCSDPRSDVRHEFCSPI